MASPKKIVIINKSDSTGGAAVVSRRLMEALRAQGADARMLVCEKLTDSPYVEVAAGKLRRSVPFIVERLKIFLANGFDRETLFKIDTASDGLPLWRHPLVKGADAILLNWVNQGMLSLEGVKKILELGKPVIWTMHDMWCMTGICHHSGRCERYTGECGDCPLLKAKAAPGDLSNVVWKRKSTLAEQGNQPIYVAVSNWLAAKAAASSLLGGADVRVIPNAFDLTFPADEAVDGSVAAPDGKIRLLFGAARLDDPIKGLPVLKEMTRLLAENHQQLASRLELVTFGGVKYPENLEGFGIPHRHLGVIKGEANVRKVYGDCHIVVSTSEYETLPGTLVEAQAFGCLPVSFNRGGQADIIDHLSTGFLAERGASDSEAARNITEGVVWACGIIGDPEKYAEVRCAMRDNVRLKFSPEAVARQYLALM